MELKELSIEEKVNTNGGSFLLGLVVFWISMSITVAIIEGV